MARKKEALPSVKLTDMGIEVEDDWYGTVLAFELTPYQGNPVFWSKNLKDHIANQLLKDPRYLEHTKDPGYVTIMKDTEFEVSPELPVATSPKDFSHWMKNRYEKNSYFVSVVKQYYIWDEHGYAIPREG